MAVETSASFTPSGGGGVVMNLESWDELQFVFFLAIVHRANVQGFVNFKKKTINKDLQIRLQQ